MVLFAVFVRGILSLVADATFYDIRTWKEETDVVMPLINQQRNSKDCGLFDKANITEFYFTNFKGIDSGGRRTVCCCSNSLEPSKRLLKVLGEPPIQY